MKLRNTSFSPLHAGLAVAWAAVLACPTTLVEAQSPALPADFKLSPSGAFTVGGVEFTVIHFDKNWNRYRLQKEVLRPDSLAAASTQTPRGPAEISGSFAGLFHLWQNSVPTAPAAGESVAWSHDVRLEAAEPGETVFTEELALEAFLPGIQYEGQMLLIDGTPYTLPVEAGEARAFEQTPVREVVIPTEAGRLRVSGEFSFFIQDNRGYRQRQGYLLRFRLSPFRGEIARADQQLDFALTPWKAGEPGIKPLKRYEIKEGLDWLSLDHRVTWDAGTVFDFSFLNDGPAGSHGRVVATDSGQLEFSDQPGVPVRFYGANLCMMANYQDPADADRLADQLARMGYNTIRIHHYDRELGQGPGTTSVELKPDALDKLDYLVYALKQRGIYLSFDLYNLRLPREGEIEGWSDPQAYLYDYIKNYKMMAAVDPATEENYRTFVSNLLNHRNPYTGYAWKDDPALLSVCIWNEANIYAFWERQKDLYLDAFKDWLRAQGATDEEVAEAAQGANNPRFERFLYDMQMRMFERGRSFMDELGVQALISDLNMHPHIALNLIRSRMELVENHIYWDHPKYLTANHQPPMGFTNRSVVFDGAIVPASIMPTRIFGKPFALTEYHFSGPNWYRAEAGPIVGAYAALQGWNIVHRFAYAHYPEPTQKPAALRHFDIVTDAVSLLSDRIAVLLFRRGDVQESSTCIPFVMSEKWLEQPGIFEWRTGRVPDQYSRLGLVVKIGSVNLTGDADLPAGFPAAVGLEDFDTATWDGRPLLKPDDMLAQRLASSGLLGDGIFDPKGGRFQSDTGEISVDAKNGTFAVITPRTECIVVNRETQVDGDALHVSGVTGGFAVISVSALEDAPVESADRLVLFHLTNVQNSGMIYNDETGTVLEDWGDLPHLARAGAATVSLRRDDPANDEVWRVDLSGRRVERVPSAVAGDELVFDISVKSEAGATFAYEISSNL
jgi:hypothetical protein